MFLNTLCKDGIFLFSFFFLICHVIFTFGDILHLLLLGALDFPLGTEASNERPNKPLNEVLHKLTLITNLGFVVV